MPPVWPRPSPRPPPHSSHHIMSTSLPIPKRKQPLDRPAYTGLSWSSSASSSYSRPAEASPSAPSPLHRGKHPASPSQADQVSPRRPSLLGRSRARWQKTPTLVGQSRCTDAVPIPRELAVQVRAHGDQPSTLGWPTTTSMLIERGPALIGFAF